MTTIVVVIDGLGTVEVAAPSPEAAWQEALHQIDQLRRAADVHSLLHTHEGDV